MSLIGVPFLSNAPFGRTAYVSDEVLLRVRFAEMLVDVAYAAADWIHYRLRCYFPYLLNQKGAVAHRLEQDHGEH